MSTFPQQQQQQQSSNSASLSFSEVSKLFSLPLSDAADTLGVSTSALKKICHDNGLVRWPYRKFLSGKSIEDIIKDAAQEKKKEPAELLKAAGGRIDDVTSFSISSSGSQLQNKISTSVQEVSKSRSITQQLGNKNVQSAKLQDLHSSNLTSGTRLVFDEFKYGFPSDGLSTTYNKWWESSTRNNNEDAHGKEEKDTNDGSGKDKVEIKIGINDKSNIVPEGTHLLSAVRNRAVDEERKALKLGVYRVYGVNKLARRERRLLLGIFGSSMPSQW